MRTLRNLVVAAGLLAALAPATALAAPPDDPDVVVHDDKGDPQQGGRSFDIAYAKDGTLCGAWVVVDPAQGDTLVIASSQDRGRTWLIIDRHTFPIHKILDLSLDVACGFTVGDRKVHVAVATSLPPPYRREVEIRGFTRSYVTPQGYGGVHRPAENYRIGAYLHPYRDPLPDGIALCTAVIPLGARPEDGYSVAVAFAWKAQAYSWPTRLYDVYVAYSYPIANAIGPVVFQQPRLVAGTGGMMDPGGTYTHPSIVADTGSSEVAIAFADQASGVVHIASQDIGAHILGGRPLVLRYSTPANDGRREFSPTLAAAAGQLNFTCLAGHVRDGYAYTLTWYHGDTRGSGFREVSVLHGYARNADIRVDEGNVFIVALCVIDPTGFPDDYGLEALAFEGSRRPLPGGGATPALPGMRVNDLALRGSDGNSMTPKVARTPDGSPFSARAYGYSTHQSDARTNHGEYAGTVAIDP